MSKKKRNSKPKKNSNTSFGSAMGLQTKRYNNETTDFLAGLVLLIFAIYLIIAMVSYLNTGAADQSLLEELRPYEWINSDHEFANYCGSVGAIISYALITVNFGFPAFFIPAFIVLVGLKLMRAYTVNLWKWFFGMAVIMVWSSVVLAKFLTPLAGGLTFNPGGRHGLYVVQAIENVVGPPGLTAILFFVAIVFLTFISAETITVIKKTLNPVRYLTHRVKLTVTNIHSKDDDEEETTSEENPEQEETPADIPPAPEDNDETSSTVIPLEVPVSTVTNKVEEKVDDKEKKPEDELTVEIAKEEEKANTKTLNEEVDLSTPINPREPFIHYKFPTLDLLKKYDSNKPLINMQEIQDNNQRIIEVLNSFGVKISKINATVGPTITLYEITPAEGVRINKIRNLEDDIALNLTALGIRIIAPMPGRGTIGIEVPNKKPQIVSMESILNTKKFKESKMELPVAIGKTISNDVYMFDLHKLPHLLVAGATGQGKSVGLNAIITSLLYKKHPNELKFVLVDPKKVEFSIYRKIAGHYMAALEENEDEPIITDVQKVVKTLKSLCELMDHRYDLLQMAQVRKIEEYNEKFINHKLDPTKGHAFMPYIVVIIDEFGDLIMTAGKEIELPIARIAQLARAVGIHMVIATQRPTTKIITGNIKANFPGRIAFRVTSVTDSRTILDRKGAEQLVGRGDMLFLSGGDPVRIQCAFIDTPEIEAISDFISSQPGPVQPLELPEPKDDSEGGGNGGNADIQSLDPLFEDAAHAIVLSQQGSTSMIQRRFAIGYNRAGRLMDQLESVGIVGPAQGSKPRDVLISDDNQLDKLLLSIHSK
ncbi:MAG: DNA translocase FtsK 4TM domain-containing protein [Prevotella sp.]|jgi:S-DNA-T family DNA segregation ATPase FtsK/SpoIIIE